MSTAEQRLRLANLIVQVLNGEISSSDALKITEEWNDMPWKEKQRDAAWHMLVHFDIDQDIRAKDSEYDASIRAGLLKFASALKG
jgi:hypothetical protein